MWASWADGDEELLQGAEEPNDAPAAEGAALDPAAPALLDATAVAGYEHSLPLGGAITSPAVPLSCSVKEGSGLALPPGPTFSVDPFASAAVPLQPAELQLSGDSCEVCGSGEDADAMLLCDGCVAGYHIHCLSPPLAAVPDGDWYCADCDRLGARTMVLSEKKAIIVARKYYDSEQAVLGMRYKMKVLKAFRNSARIWSLRYKTVPSSGGPHFA